MLRYYISEREAEVDEERNNNPEQNDKYHLEDINIDDILGNRHLACGAIALMYTFTYTNISRSYLHEIFDLLYGRTGILKVYNNISSYGPARSEQCKILLILNKSNQCGELSQVYYWFKRTLEKKYDKVPDPIVMVIRSDRSLNKKIAMFKSSRKKIVVLDPS